MIDRRTDDQWTSDLASSEPSRRDDAVQDLRDMLLRGLAGSLSRTGRVDAAFLEDVAQESTMRVLEKLGDFERRCKFRTWAVTIAVRTAISKMRHREWRNVSLDAASTSVDFDPRIAIDSSATSEQMNSRVELLRTLRELIDRELTERQRTALIAELGGMPLAQIAEKLGSNPNSVYKLMHDARKNLRRGMEAAGFTIDDVREAWGAGETWR
jgi:RNA polymerase sigma-70 factor (ECF subfamily)